MRSFLLHTQDNCLALNPVVGVYVCTRVFACVCTYVCEGQRLTSGSFFVALHTGFETGTLTKP